jgi:hypothetical protein
MGAERHKGYECMTRVLRAAWLLISLFLMTTRLMAQDPISDLLNRTNQLRAGFGLGAYTLNGALSSAAQNQATWMATTGAVSHVQPDGSRPRDRAAAAGYNSPWVNENIYVGGMATTDTAWTFWINSAIHYAALTSPNYSDVGIAWATGENNKAFVMVFGAPAEQVAMPALPPANSAPPPSNSDGGGQTGNASVAASDPNSNAGVSRPRVRQRVIVGLDAVGNMMHEVQEGDTLGDIAMLYGYSWDVIPTMMAINRMTEEEIRGIKVGSVLLVPPHEGTYTPTPEPPTPTMLPTVTPYSLNAFLTPSATMSPQAVAMAADAGTLLPSPTSGTPPATVSSLVVQASATETPAPTPMPGTSVSTANDYRGPLLMVVVGIQMIFLGGATFEAFRRRRQRHSL